MDTAGQVGRAMVPEGVVGHDQGRRSEATRYLCAAAHVDEEFRTEAIQELLFHPERAVAPSYGIDVVPILRHCLLARRRVMARDGVLSALILVALVVSPTTAIPLGFCACAVAVGLRWWQASVSRLGLRRPGPAPRSSSAILGLVVLLVALVVLLPLAMQFLSMTFHYLAWVSVTLRDPAISTVTVVIPLLVLCVLVVHRAVVHLHVVDSLQPQAFANSQDPPAPPWAERRLRDLESAQHGNVTYVSEAARSRPFVGSGPIDEAFSFAIPLVGAESRDDPSGGVIAGDSVGSAAESRPLTARDVYEALRSAALALGPGRGRDPRDPRFRGLSIQDRLYVHGRLRPGSPYLDPSSGSPRPLVGPDCIEEVTTAERGAERRYLVVRVATWGGEVETSVFFYVAIRGDMLYVEYVATTIPPLAGKFHAVDSFERLTGEVLLRLTGGSVLDVVRVAPLAPFRLVREALLRWQFEVSSSQEKRAIARRLSYDYGARFGLRELGAGAPSWFAEADAHEVRSLIVRRALGAIADELRSRGYDLMEFDQRANVVINQSATNLSGATITNSSIATGTSAVSMGGPGPAAGKGV